MLKWKTRQLLSTTTDEWQTGEVTIGVNNYGEKGGYIYWHPVIFFALVDRIDGDEIIEFIVPVTPELNPYYFTITKFCIRKKGEESFYYDEVFYLNESELIEALVKGKTDETP